MPLVDAKKTYYCEVILPLKLDFAPTYSCEQSLPMGTRVEVDFAGKVYSAVVCAEGRESTQFEIKPILRVQSELPMISLHELKVWRMVAEYYCCSVGLVYKAAYPAIKIKNEAPLKRKNSRKTKDREAEAEKIVLTMAQQKASEEIETALQMGRKVLLEGTTASGKTYLYADHILKAIENGGQALFLVSEIALSRQMEMRLKRLFGRDMVYSYHSGMTSAAKRDVASRIRSGQKTVILGTRSSIFLPFNGLRMIVVDEEDDSSYKQDSPAPRYNARDVASFLSAVHGAGLILGSATPSLESLYNVRTGKYAHVRIDEKYNAHQAQVEIIDTGAERKKGGMHGPFSRKLLRMMAETLKEGHQIMLLRSRRSFSPLMQCEACGYIPKCPNCGVALSYHKDGDRLKCHLCSRSYPYVDKCPECGGHLQGIGAGTQKIEEQVAEFFPDAKVARLDGDLTSVQARDVVKDFTAGRVQILVGTQMIGKGFDFDNVTLVALLSSDSLFSHESFRSDERAASQVLQLWGRCARRQSPGTFVIQTVNPEHPFFEALQKSGTGEFRQSLLRERQEFGYPPFSRIIDLCCKAGSEAVSRGAAESLELLLRNHFKLQGPFPRQGSDGQSCWVVRLFIPKDRDSQHRKAQALEIIRKYESQSKADIYLDVDPL